MTRFFIAALTLLSITISAWAASPDIGAVARTRGDTILVRGALPQALSGDEGIRYADALRTGNDSRLEVAFIDGSVLTLGDDAEIQIDEMVYAPGARGSGSLHLTQGVFRMVTGAINKVPDGRLTVITPLATIGVRGTDFWGDQNADRLLLALLDDGQLDVRVGGRTITLTVPRTAILIERGKPPGAVFPLTDQQLADAVKTIAW